jgi:hypothetical protein
MLTCWCRRQQCRWSVLCRSRHPLVWPPSWPWSLSRPCPASHLFLRPAPCLLPPAPLRHPKPPRRPQQQRCSRKPASRRPPPTRSFLDTLTTRTPSISLFPTFAPEDALVEIASTTSTFSDLKVYDSDHISFEVQTNQKFNSSQSGCLPAVPILEAA